MTISDEIQCAVIESVTSEEAIEPLLVDKNHLTFSLECVISVFVSCPVVGSSGFLAQIPNLSESVKSVGGSK